MSTSIQDTNRGPRDRRRRRARARAGLVLLAALLPASLAQGAPPQVVIRDPDSLPPLEDLIREGLAHSAQGDLESASRSWERVRELYPGHPAGPIFEIHTLDARKALDVQDDRYDEALHAKVEEALALSGSWIERAPDDPQAHFYAGQAKVHKMIITGMAGQYYQAGMTGEQGRKHLERALELDPTLVDAKLPLGSYHYYTSIATRFIRWFSWLWFVPVGDRELGLAYVEEASQRGNLFRFDASAQLASLYLYLENQPDRAAPILDRLHAAHPENSHLAFEVVELRLLQGDYAGTIEKALEIEAGTGTQFGDATRRTMAKIWRARAELMRGQPERAGELLAELDPQSESLSPWCQRWIALAQGNLADVLDQRSAAIAHYERVIELESRWKSGRSVQLARQGLETPFQIGADPAAPLVSAAPPAKPPRPTE